MRRMRRLALPALALVFALTSSAAARRDDTLASAYSSILNGDYEGGRSTLLRLREAGKPSDTLDALGRWIDSFDQATASRDELRQKICDWNIEQARQASADGKLYLALSYTLQASFYAADEKTFARADWVQDLRTRWLAAADGYVKNEKWSKAHAHYLGLERLYPDDDEIKQLRERTARFVRLEILYKNDAELQRRIKGVNAGLLQQIVGNIAQMYYEKPDFKAMAEGALDALDALCHTTKLYNASKVFDGLASATAREHFLAKLAQQRREIAASTHVDERTLLGLYKTLRDVNKVSVSLPEELLVMEFTEGALNRLDDYTTPIWPVDAEDFDKQMVGNFGGVGIQLGSDKATNRLNVFSPLEDSPALRAGVQPGDIIEEVDGQSTKDWTSDEAVRKITGERGTTVKLTLFRPSTGKRTVYELTRGTIKITTVRGVNRLQSEGDGYKRWNYMLDPAAGIGYIALKGFNPESRDELVNALREAQKQGMKGLVLDLRYNPGGLLDSAVDIVSLFVSKGGVVSTRGRDSRDVEKLDVSGDDDFADLPLVVLVNDGSASAAEILSGALQAHDRALVLGERTFGKGSVQKVMALGGNREGRRPRLKLTTALYYLPDGRSPHKKLDAEHWGVDPNLTVKLTPKEIQKTLERERSAYIIHNENSTEVALDDAERAKALESLKVDDAADDKEDEPLLSTAEIKKLGECPYEVPDRDPQIETALLHMRVKLAANLPWPRAIAQRPAKPAPQP